IEHVLQAEEHDLVEASAAALEVRVHALGSGRVLEPVRDLVAVREQEAVPTRHGTVLPFEDGGATRRTRACPRETTARNAAPPAGGDRSWARRDVRAAVAV